MSIRQFISVIFTLLLLLGAWYLPSNWLAVDKVNGTINSELATFQGVAMTMPYQVSVEAPLTDKQSADCEAVIAKVFKRINDVFNCWNPRSQLSIFNAFHSTTPMAIEPDLFALLSMVHDVNFISHGLYDPSIITVSRLWRQYLKNGTIPPHHVRKPAEDAVGWSQIKLLPPNKISKISPELQLDLGSIAKGYAVDLICEDLRRLNFKHIFVEWAGEVRVLGGHPTHRDWVVGIKTPRKRDYGFLAKIDLLDGAIATSGHDELFWLAVDENGQTHSFSHLIHPLSKTPLYIEHREILSCTVLAPTCMLADSLSTAGLLTNQVDEATSWARDVIQKWPEVSIFFFTKDQQLWHFQGKNSASYYKTTGAVTLYHALTL